MGVKAAGTRADVQRENEGGLICSTSRTAFRPGFKQEKDKIQFICFCVFKFYVLSYNSSTIQFVH